VAQAPDPHDPFAGGSDAHMSLPRLGARKDERQARGERGVKRFASSCRSWSEIDSPRRLDGIEPVTVVTVRGKRAIQSR